MKEEQLILKIKLLKRMQPSRTVFNEIKHDVYQQVQAENQRTTFPIHGLFEDIFTLRRLYNSAFYSVAFALFLIVFLSISYTFFPNQLHNSILYGRLAVAPNQYEKAHIALEDTKNRFANDKIVHADTNELAYSLALTNSELNGLKLKGENGQYTASECHQIYQEYFTYLQSKEKVIPSTNTMLKSKINSYEEQAEKKLHMYKSL